jgi:DNA-binding NtrC family response regulator
VLFLDELETLELPHQAKLLRVLDDGKVRPVGSEAALQVSVRFVAATNRDPAEMIAANALRPDLYYRLRGFEIQLPPLAMRREDIPLLARHFLGPDLPGFSDEAMDLLSRAPWPGNVRELRNVVATARAAADCAPITARHLGPDFAKQTRAHERPAPRGASLREIERDAIVRTIEECGGNRTQAAQVLGIDRSTLRRKLREFGIEA